MANFPASLSSKTKSPKGGKSGRPAQLQAAAQLLAEAVTSFTEPDPKRGRRVNRALSFAQAYSSLGRAVPRQSRLAVFREMEKALAKTIKEAELEESPVTQTVAGKAQQENDTFMANLRNEDRISRARDITTKKLLTSAEMRERLGFTAQALSAAVRAKRMFVLTGPSGENFYPAFFSDAKYDRPVLEKISKSLGGLSGGSKWEFFTTPKISLANKTPLDALAKGKIEQVLITVAGFLEE